MVDQEQKLNVLLFTFFVISSLPMNKEHSKVERVEISDGGLKAGWEAPCKSHQEVTPSED